MSGDNDRPTRTADTNPAASREPAAEPAAGGDQQRRQTAPMVQVNGDGDDHEEAGYGYGV